MYSTRERAVEAGARAICADYDELPELATWAERKAKSDRLWVDRQEVHEDVAVILRAAFPVQAGELAREIEAEAVALEQRASSRSDVGDFKEAYLDRIASTATMDVASKLRARIQQMAEAERWPGRSSRPIVRSWTPLMRPRTTSATRAPTSSSTS